MPALYANVSPAVLLYVQELAEQNRTTQARVINLLLEEARRQGWTIERGTDMVLRPE
jgi:hypothetical protein